MAYQFGQADTERERLAKIEDALDAFTIECLESIGVSDGWRCLEIGAGGGSIARWLSRRVGDSGHVVATDLETKYLRQIELPNMEIRRHDVAVDPLEQEAFDVVCARKVLEHLEEPVMALNRMHAAVRPGGWLLVEDTDLVSLRHVVAPNVHLFNRIYAAFIDLLSSSGFNPTLGLQLGQELRALGLRQVQMEGRTTQWTGADNHATGALYSMTVDRLRKRLIESCGIEANDVDQFLTDIQSPDFHAVTSIHFAAWGRKRASG